MTPEVHAEYVRTTAMQAMKDQAEVTDRVGKMEQEVIGGTARGMLQSGT